MKKSIPFSKIIIAIAVAITFVACKKDIDSKPATTVARKGTDGSTETKGPEPTPDQFKAKTTVKPTSYTGGTSTGDTTTVKAR